MTHKTSVKSSFGIIPLLAIGTLLLSAAVGIYFYFARTQVVSFYYEHDADAVRELIKKDWELLFSHDNDLRPEDIEEMMKYGVLEKRGGRSSAPAIIKVILADGAARSAIVYYRQRQARGYIQFLVTDANYRGRGYGRMLMNYAIKDLFRQGVSFIHMSTRLDDSIARKLYESLGFKEQMRDGNYIEYRLVPEDYRPS